MRPVFYCHPRAGGDPEPKMTSLPGSPVNPGMTKKKRQPSNFLTLYYTAPRLIFYNIAMTLSRKQIALAVEFLLVFAGLPLLVLMLRDRGFMIMLLWGGALVVYGVMHRWYERKHGTEWNWPGLHAGLKPVLIRFACLAPLITAITWFVFRDSNQFLSFPRDRPDVWVKVMFIYPLLSVWPQELIYRSFIRHRYAPLFKTGAVYIAVSAIAFGFMHIMFLNPVAVTMTLIGGVLFAHSYQKYQSLALACLEHALYGCLIFTIGLGQYFFSGAAWG